MFDYKLLEALVMVVQEGGFERASRVLNITQSAVSQRVRQLEERTGQVLLSRTNPPLPTSVGRVLVKHYRQVRLLEDGLFEDQSGEMGSPFTSLALGVNADSLATWFSEATRNFLLEEKVVFDLRVEDQEETHRLLKNGDVVGCISTSDTVMQGCRLDYLGCMVYRLLASPGFAARWFPQGVNREALEQAPGILFNRRDRLNESFFQALWGKEDLAGPSFFVPSSESFVDFIVAGLAYGLVPDQQSGVLLKKGALVELIPGQQLRVPLFWHCWSLESELLVKLSRCLVQAATQTLSR